MTWYLARSGGLVALALLTASTVWGLLMTTRIAGRQVKGRDLADWHRFLAGLAVAFTAVHVGAIMLDGYVSFGLADVLVPFASPVDRLATAWGVIAMWMLLAVYLTSLARKRMPTRAWRRVHFLSFGLFWFAAVHSLTGGTDAGNPVVGGAMVGAVALVAVLTLMRIARAAGRSRAREAAAPPPRPAATRQPA